MQKIATRIFVCASIVFGIIGILLVLTLPGENETSSGLNMLLSRLLFITVFVILPSFALSIAGKYLNGKR
jgi:Na+/H+ antiporter NhaA